VEPIVNPGIAAVAFAAGGLLTLRLGLRQSLNLFLPLVLLDERILGLIFVFIVGLLIEDILLCGLVCAVENCQSWTPN
jgi:hypothetical protein